MAVALYAFQQSPVLPGNPWTNLVVSVAGGAVLYFATLALLQFQKLKTLSLQLVNTLKGRAATG
ncbi:MAG: hypothetical protein GWO24_01640 [Akkermansiaceae bacterium]|nr:hypothetical protein [Akkermansiaceae bacterium]NIV19226.1 hypothetical protein [Gammaproteobacteria bacterium]